MEIVNLPPLPTPSSPVLPTQAAVETPSNNENISMSSVRDTIKRLMVTHNYDPFKEMILIAKSIDTPLKIRSAMATELAQYIAPKLKGLDIDAKASGSISVIVQKFADDVMREASPPVIDVTEVKELENERHEPL